MPQRRTISDDEDDEEEEDAAELSGWGNADFDAAIRLSSRTDAHAQLKPARAAAKAWKKERQRRWEERKSARALQQEQQYDEADSVLSSSNNSDNWQAARAFSILNAQVPPFKTHAGASNNCESEFVVSGCAVSTPFISTATSYSQRHSALLSLKKHRPPRQRMQQSAPRPLAPMLCKVVGLIDDLDDDGDTGDAPQYGRSKRHLHHGAEHENSWSMPSLHGSKSTDSLLSQHFRSDLEQRLRALPMPFGAHPVSQSASTAGATSASSCFLPPLLDANSLTVSSSMIKQEEHYSSMRRQHPSHHQQQQQQQGAAPAAGKHKDVSVRCVRDLMKFPATG